MSCVPRVLRILGDEQRDKVSYEELEKIKLGLEGGLLLRPHNCVQVGTRVRVRNGVFAGVEGLVSELRHQCKVIITLTGIRQCFSLEVLFDDIEILTKNMSKAKPRHAIPAFSYYL